AGPRFDRSIYRWQRAFYRALGARGKTIIMASASEGMKPADKKNTQFNAPASENLTLSDVRQLSALEPVTLDDFDKAAADLRSIAIPTAQAKLAINGAATMTQILIALSILWLWINAREIERMGPNLPAGDAFLMFSRTPFSRYLLMALLATPGVASGLLS